jgi:hypothetical protein
MEFADGVCVGDLDFEALFGFIALNPTKEADHSRQLQER